MQASRRDRSLVSMFFRCEKDCSRAHVEPNVVSTAILTRCSVWCVTASAFQLLTISWSAGASFSISAHSACCRSSLSKSSFSHMSEAFRSAAWSSKSLTETPGMELRSALSTAHWCGRVMNLERPVRSANSPKRALNDCRR